MLYWQSEWWYNTNIYGIVRSTFGKFLFVIYNTFPFEYSITFSIDKNMSSFLNVEWDSYIFIYLLLLILNNIIWDNIYIRYIHQTTNGINEYFTIEQYLSQSLPYFLLHLYWSLPYLWSIIIVKNVG